MACPVCCWMLVIMPEISSVAWRVRAARPRTSSATTANPRPISPARAASMAAFSASRLVCSAIAVITLMMPPISCERAPRLSITVAVPPRASAICFSEREASSMALRPMRVCWALSRAMRSVPDMLSAMFIEVALNSSTAPAMLVISPDCWSMPSQAPADSPDSERARLLTCSEALRMCSTMVDSASPILLKLRASCPISSWLVTASRALKSPAPSASAWRTRSSSGRSLRRSSHNVAATASSIASRLPIARRRPTLQVTSRISAIGMLATTVHGPSANGAVALYSCCSALAGGTSH
ncbi:hypothetical protein D3C79_727390 [compost metagenome]